VAEGNGLLNRCMATLTNIVFSKFFSTLQAVLNLQSLLCPLLCSRRVFCCAPFLRGEELSIALGRGDALVAEPVLKVVQTAAGAHILDGMQMPQIGGSRRSGSQWRSILDCAAPGRVPEAGAVFCRGAQPPEHHPSADDRNNRTNKTSGCRPATGCGKRVPDLFVVAK